MGKKRCIVLADRCPYCLRYHFEVVDMVRYGNIVRRFLMCLGCGQASQADELNLLATWILVNPDLEDGFSKRGASEITIADGWEPWDTHVTFWPGGIKRPESKPSQTLVHSGKFSQKQFHRYTLWRGGIQQKLKVTPGQWYRFSCWAWIYCSTRDDNVSKGGRFRARVGINPWGAWPHHYASVCGKEVLEYDKWVKIEVVAQAWSEEITVFSEGMAEHQVSHNDVYWDDFTFEPMDWGSPPPEPSPEPPPMTGECGFVNKWAEVLDNQAEILQRLEQMPKHGDTITL